MTGFARAERQAGALRARVEIKSVNGRGLDLRLRLAPGLDTLEVPLRHLMSKALARGSVNLVATLDRANATATVRVNQNALSVVLAAIDQLRAHEPMAVSRPEAILALPGVLETDDGAGELDEDALSALMLDCAGEAVDRLRAARLQEGAELASILHAQLDAIAGLVAMAQTHPMRSRSAVEARLIQQLEGLRLDIGLPQDRLAQEALLLATKADIQEELDRLTAHLAAARKLIAEGGAVGRRLDFLAQEELGQHEKREHEDNDEQEARQRVDKAGPVIGFLSAAGARSGHS